MTLDQLLPGEQGVVARVEAEGLLLLRLLDLGFVPGTTVQACLISRGGSPIAYRVRGAVLALRRSTAQRIIIRAEEGIPWQQTI